MYASIGFLSDDLPVRIDVTRRQDKVVNLHVVIEGDNFRVLLDEATARTLRDALNAVLPADGGIDERGWPAAGPRSAAAESTS